MYCQMFEPSNKRGSQHPLLKYAWLATRHCRYAFIIFKTNPFDSICLLFHNKVN
uniref:Uncharacterized protein n=1 Tax=Rhizophora mucronata TaxID=61149 RepID=A0A2P2PWA7_RHIMU